MSDTETSSDESAQGDAAQANYLYSPTARGFFHAAYHAEWPNDVIPVTPAAHAALMAAQAAGQVIVPGPDGAPVAVDQPIEVPARVTRLAARLACLAQPAPAGSGAPHLWAWLEAWAAAPERSDLERAYWSDAPHWRRDDPLVVALSAAAGLSPAAVDALFVAAT